MRKKRRYAFVSPAVACASTIARPRAPRRRSRPSRSMIAYRASWATTSFKPKQCIWLAPTDDIQPWALLQVAVILLRAQPSPLALDIADIEQQVGGLRLLGDQVEIGRCQVE